MLKEVFALKGILLYLGVFLFSSLASVILFAAAMLFLEIDFSYATLFATISVAIGVLLTSFFVAKKSKQKGFLIGFITGISIFVLFTLSSLFTSDSHFTLNTLFRLIIYILSGSCGGIIAVNKANKKKYF